MGKLANISVRIPFEFGDAGELKLKRNRVLTARYYYYFHILRRRPDDIYILLAENEFFLKPDTVYRILTEDRQNNFLNELIQTSATSARLQKMFPGWRWQ